jgi:hypothetical protein
VPTTTKYSDFRKNRELIQRQLVSSSDDDLEYDRERIRGGGSPPKQKNNHKATSSFVSY